MSIATDRSSIIRSKFAPDEQGNYSSVRPIQAKIGDTIELAFTGVVGIGKLGDLDVAVRGEAVKLDGVKGVVNLVSGRMLIGEAEVNAVLVAEQPGRSVVDITVLAPDGSPSGVLAVAIDVA